MSWIFDSVFNLYIDYDVIAKVLLFLYFSINVAQLGIRFVTFLRGSIVEKGSN